MVRDGTMKSRLDLFRRIGLFGEREVMIRQLRDLFSVINRHEAQACIMFGTRLGKLRHDDFLEKRAPELEAMGYVIQPDIRDGRRTGCRVFHRNNLEIRGSQTLRFPWIGIWEHEMRGTDTLTLAPEEFRYAVEDFFPLKQVDFLGFRVAVPHRSESVLDTYFGSADWMEYCVLPEQDHRSGGVATNFPKDKFKVREVLDHLSGLKQSLT